MRYWPEEGPIERLFFAHRCSIDLLKYNYDLLIMDCTYNTNRFKMKLFDIVGVSKLNRTFYAAFCLLKREDSETFKWALQCLGHLYGEFIPADFPTTVITDRDLALIDALKEVFPNTARLLCIWHIEKNLVKHCKPCIFQQTFLSGLLDGLGSCEKETMVDEQWRSFLRNWNCVVYAKTELQFWKEWDKFKSTYEEFPAIISYIRSTWMDYRESWACAWTDQVLHLEQRATSRSEGAHHIVKSALDGHGDLSQVVHRVELLVLRQSREEAAETDRQMAVRATELFRSHRSSGRPSDINISFFRDLWGNVPLNPIRRAAEQYNQLRQHPQPLPRCTSVFRNSTGFPCKHMILERLFRNEALQPSDFHPQWQFFRGDGKGNYLDPRLLVCDPSREASEILSLDCKWSRSIRI
jgi:hypothetical protein